MDIVPCSLDVMYFTEGQIMLSEDWEYRSATQAGKKDSNKTQQMTIKA